MTTTIAFFSAPYYYSFLSWLAPRLVEQPQPWLTSCICLTLSDSMKRIISYSDSTPTDIIFCLQNYNNWFARPEGNGKQQARVGEGGGEGEGERLETHPLHFFSYLLVFRKL